MALGNENNLTKNTILLAIGNILTKGLLFVMVPFFSRWLSTEDYGLFDLFCTYVALLIPIITLSTGEAMFRYSIQKSTTKKEKKIYITNCFFLVFVNCAFVSLLLVISKFIFNWEMAIPFILLMIGEIFNNYLQSYLRALKKLSIYSFCSAFSVIVISILVTVFVYYLNMGLSGIIYGYALGYIISDVLIASFTKLYKYLMFSQISLKTIKELIFYSYPLIPNSISWWIVNVSDRFIIKLFLGISANGIYAIANKIPAICTAIFSVFNISWQQEATEIIESGRKNLDEYFNKVYNNIIRIIISICIGVLSCNFILFNYIFDAKYFDAYLFSPILISAIIFMLLSQFYGGIQISLKMPKENGTTTMIGAFMNIVINVLLIKLFGLFAAAISTLLSYLFVDVLRKGKLKNIVNFKINKNNYIVIAIYFYFFVASYFINYLIFSYINLIIACILFFYLNKKFFAKILNKVKFF